MLIGEYALLGSDVIDWSDALGYSFELICWLNKVSGESRVYGKLAAKVWSNKDISSRNWSLSSVSTLLLLLWCPCIVLKYTSTSVDTWLGAITANRSRRKVANAIFSRLYRWTPEGWLLTISVAMAVIKLSNTKKYWSSRMTGGRFPSRLMRKIRLFKIILNSNEPWSASNVLVSFKCCGEFFCIECTSRG